MTSHLSVREVTASYGELVLVEQAAMDLLAGLGWTVKNLYGETFGAQSTEGRVSEHQVVMPRRLHTALESLNPGLPADAYAQAVEQLTQDRSKQIAVNAIYLDKPMRAHTLMQTIARANRVAPGKESGLIVDYVGIFAHARGVTLVTIAAAQGFDHYVGAGVSTYASAGRRPL